MKLGVIDVGGGMRGIYAAGVLDRCLEEDVRFDCCIGVSAGSANLSCYLSGQHGRCKRFYSEYSFRKRYMSFGNLLRTGSYLGLDYIYGTLSRADGEDPLGYAAIAAASADFVVIAEEAHTGAPKYFTKADLAQDDYRPLMASSCIPGIDRPYPIDGVPYYDGALADPVPVQLAFDLGCDKVVLILTRPAAVPREPGKDRLLARLIRRRYPISAEKIAHRADAYNASVALARRYEAEGRLYLVSPDDTDGVTTLSRDKEAMERLYQRGHRDGAGIARWLDEGRDG